MNGFGFQGVQDFFTKGVLPCLMVYLVLNMYWQGKKGNYGKLLALVGTFMIPTVLLAFVLVPDAILGLGTSIKSLFEKG